MLYHSYLPMVDQLHTSQAELEKRVSARTKSIELSAAISRRLSTLLDRNKAVTEVVKLLQSTYHYYYVQVYQLNETTEQLEIVEATGAAGKKAIALKRVIPLGEGIMGRAATLKATLRVSDVTQYPYWVPHPFLPETQSELAVPIILAGRVLGVIDVQSNKTDAFNTQDVRVLETIADQLAITIHNTELFEIAQAARAEAEKSDALKSKFLANMSHELRTPLNAVINFAFLLLTDEEQPLASEHYEIVERISEASDHLLGLINNILDLSRIESGLVELSPTKLSLSPMIQSATATGVGLIQGEPIYIEQFVPDTLPPAYADRTRVRQVLLNLISNAVKFTKSGDIILRAKADDEWITISVQDSGIGIAPENLAKIFEEFVQIEDEQTTQIKGTGLGLPISRRFVEMQGGKMWVESIVNVGSTFYFTLPRWHPENHP